MNGKETQLQHGLSQLRSRLLVMCANVGIAVDEACGALASGNLEMANRVIAEEFFVDALENEIDGMVMRLLVRNQPVAQDLRFIMASLRMTIYLERIGDEAAGIAERAVSLKERPPAALLDAITPLMENAGIFYKQAMEAFRTGNAEQALALCQSDVEAIRMEVTALRRIITDFCHIDRENAAYSHIVMHGILTCHSFCRICCQAFNIAEDTYFIVTGENIRHKCRPPTETGT